MRRCQLYEMRATSLDQDGSLSYLIDHIAQNTHEPVIILVDQPMGSRPSVTTTGKNYVVVIF